MKKVIPILNPDKDHSAAHAFDGSRVAPRPIYDPPWGEHPDDDRFITVEVDAEKVIGPRIEVPPAKPPHSELVDPEIVAEVEAEAERKMTDLLLYGDDS